MSRRRNNPKHAKKVCSIIVKEHALIYDKVLWIIDLDVLIKEHEEQKHQRRSKLDDLKTYISEILNEYDNVQHESDVQD